MKWDSRNSIKSGIDIIFKWEWYEIPNSASRILEMKDSYFVIELKLLGFLNLLLKDEVERLGKTDLKGKTWAYDLIFCLFGSCQREILISETH